MNGCKGMNCGCTDGVSHSLECHAEHAAAIAGGMFVKAVKAEPLPEPYRAGTLTSNPDGTAKISLYFDDKNQAEAWFDEFMKSAYAVVQKEGE